MSNVRGHQTVADSVADETCRGWLEAWWTEASGHLTLPAEDLARYDVVILHAPAATPEVVKQLKQRGVVTIGYITVGADLEVRDGNRKGPGGKASWYFDKDHDGHPDIDPVWKTPWANTADPEWRKFCVAEARRLVEEVGFDGLFLDTTDNVTIYPEMFDGMVELIGDFRRELPQAPIIMNQSWELLRKCAPIVDGVMLEGFTTSYNFETKQYRRNPINWDDNGLRSVKKYVLPARENHSVQVFVLDYCRPDETDLLQSAADRAAAFGFLHCSAPVSLDDIYAPRVTPHPDPKYLKPHATSESMAVMLEAPRNGFPAGTQVLPSGCFGGYAVAPVVDGLEDRTGSDWSKVAWASAEDGEPAFLEIRLPQPVTGGSLRIEWQARAASRRFAVQVRPEAAKGAWSAVKSFQDNHDETTVVALPPGERYQALRIFQDPGGGSADRPNLMWIARVKLLP